VTADLGVQGSIRSTDATEKNPATTAILSAVAAAPQRLLIVLLCFCYVAAAAYVTGVFRPVLVFPATAIVVLLTWRLVPGRRTPGWPPGVGAIAAIVIAGGWFLLNLPYVSERVQVNRDPDVYTLTALWLLDHTSPSIPVHELSSSAPAFGRVGDTLGPQGYHLVSGISAAAGWVFGEEAVFWGNLACGAAALLGLYVLGTRMLGPLWALVPVLGLAGSLPMLETSRALYSEPITMTCTFLGATLLWDAWKRNRVAEYLLAGAAFGGAALARIDGTLPLLGVLVGLTVAVFLHPGRNQRSRRWAAPLVLLGSLPGVLLGLADARLHSGPYLLALQERLELLATGFGISATICLVGALIPMRGDRLAGFARGLRFTAIAGAVLAAVAFLFLLSRPWWFVGHNARVYGLIRATQEREGVPVDGTRSYAEMTFQWISWYHGWPVVLVGLVGLLAWLVLGARGRPIQLLWLSALFLPSAILYVTAPNITPDQVWAMRRFLPVVIPGLLLATVWIARALVDRGRARGHLVFAGAVLVSAALVVSAVGWPLTTARHLWGEKNLAGALAGHREICEEIDDRPTVVAGIGPYLPTILVLCDVTAVSIKEPTPELLAEAREALGSEVFLVTHAPGTVPWDGEQLAPLTWTQQVWEMSVVGPPDEVLEETKKVWLGRVQADGTVEPVQP
jgi:Dolichyl-phosphate-mannose-protein mannosyltransferase